MSKTSPNTAVALTMDDLNAIADNLLSSVQGKPLTKNAILNVMAGQILGPRQNWGSLKAKSGPVYSAKVTRADFELAVHAQETIARAPIGFYKGGLTFLNTLSDARDEAPDRIDIPFAQYPMFYDALLGHEPCYTYFNQVCFFDRDGDTITVKSKDVAIAKFSADNLREFLDLKKELIKELFDEDDIVSDVKVAFTANEESRGEQIMQSVVDLNPLYDAHFKTMDIEDELQALGRAVNRATYAYLAGGLDHKERYKNIIGGFSGDLSDDIYDRHWEMLVEALRVEFEIMTSTK